MTKETLKKIGDSIVKPIRDLQEVERLSDLQDAISELPDLGEALKRIESKLDQILTKLNA